MHLFGKGNDFGDVNQFACFLAALRRDIGKLDFGIVRIKAASWLNESRVNAGVKLGHWAAQKSTTWPLE
jgi:hypothetical protein